MSNLKHVKRLHEMGFAVHLLRPKSKAPFEFDWSKGPRKPWITLEKTFKDGMNVGARLGKASQIRDKYLCAIDFDVKSSEPWAQKEALTALMDLKVGMTKVVCMSGRRNGSHHLYFLSDKPVVPRRLKQCARRVEVVMPSATKVSNDEQKRLTVEKIKLGVRLRPAWEISLMGEGQQVVLPPSVHPDTSQRYYWVKPDFSLDDFGTLARHLQDYEPSRPAVDNTPASTFQARDVDLTFSDLSPSVQAQIEDGSGVGDRSSALLGAACAMLKVGFSDDEILSVLTNRDYYLGQVAYDHTGSASRLRAVKWLRKFTLVKARALVAEEIDFDSAGPDIILSEADAQKQLEELCPEEEADWESRLERNDQGKLKLTLKNVITIIRKRAGEDIFKRDTFATRDTYGRAAPWGTAKPGDLITDDEVVLIKYWFAKNYRVEPKNEMLFDAITFICKQNEYHPIRDYLNGLPAWDGIERLHVGLTTYFNARLDNEEYLAQVFRKYMVAAVTRIFRPGAKFDWMIIFQGAQGKGKSSFGPNLVGDKYFKDDLARLDDKDAALGLQGSWLVEFGELARMRQADLDILKAFVTRKIDKVRPPYGRKQLEVARQCVFFGTTDRETYLKDDSGNRRFCPVQVDQCEFALLERDREQLFAEALFIFRNDLEPVLELEGEAKVYAQKIVLEKMVEDDSHVFLEALQAFEEKEEKEGGPNRMLTGYRVHLGSLFESFGPFAGWKHDARTRFFAQKALKMFGYECYKSDGKKYWRRQKGYRGSTLQGISPEGGYTLSKNANSSGKRPKNH